LDIQAALFPLVQGCHVSFSQSFSNGGCMNISHGLYNTAHPVTHCVWRSQRSAPHLKKLGAKMADAPDLVAKKWPS
jgi:hypothetical protein